MDYNWPGANFGDAQSNFNQDSVPSRQHGQALGQQSRANPTAAPFDPQEMAAYANDVQGRLQQSSQLDPGAAAYDPQPEAYGSILPASSRSYNQQFVNVSHRADAFVPQSETVATGGLASFTGPMGYDQQFNPVAADTAAFNAQSKGRLEWAQQGHWINPAAAHVELVDASGRSLGLLQQGHPANSAALDHIPQLG
ncbi:hypothetical protein KEM55_007163, partial [Ascosphaera atra]